MEIVARKPLRLWPGVVIVIIQLLLRYVVLALFPDTMLISILAGPAGGLAVLLWWLFFSRAAWVERLGALALAVAALAVTKRFVDVSIATGAMGMLFYFLAIPPLSVAFVAWAVATRRLPDRTRRLSMAATILLACAMWTMARTGGFTASFHNDLHWRWTKTPEELLVEQARKSPPAAAIVPASLPSQPAAPAPVPEEARVTPGAKEAVPPTAPAQAPPQAKIAGDWSGFRGPHRDDVVPGVKIQTDWKASPPVALWRHPVGPGWSSFAVRDGLIYTQEQRGPDEVVACYNLSTGQPVWTHSDPARFWESNGGPGPRATPSLSDGRVYTFGATGIVNALNTTSGAVIWSHNAAADTGMKTPQWGFASSPLVVGDLVIAATAGQLIAYDRQTGAKRWVGPARGVSYSSPHLYTSDGVRQVLLLSETGAASVALDDGKLLWEHAWPGYPIVQPALTGDGDVLIGVSDSSGIRRLAIAHETSGWTATERWTSKGLKPYFNDFVVHNGYAYGFDGSILSCIDLKDGKRVWKGGRYGNGQLVLLSDQDVLLVLSEEGELALVQAAPTQFTELARFPALEGKTWNHPVVAGDVLLVRNGQEMAAFRLSMEH